ncbi:MAG: sigma-70 family RNA polymerase sigma factor [Steroidobacteraceae bacterium]
MAQVLEYPDAGGREAADIDAPSLAAAQRGDRRAFERLYRRHAPEVHGLCLRMTGRRDVAEDCTQEAFIAAWRALPRFEARSRFSTWMHRIAVNAVLARRRGLAAAYEATAVALEEIESTAAAAGDAVGPLDLERAIERLPEGARHVLVLVGIYGHSHEEAGAMLGIAAGTSKAQLHRARQLLARQLGLEATQDS